MTSFLSQQILMPDELEPSPEHGTLTLGRNLGSLTTFNRILKDMGASGPIMQHQSKYDAKRSCEQWALYEEARESRMTAAEREDNRKLLGWKSEDGKSWKQRTYEDWVKLWAHWMTAHYQYLHGARDEENSHEEPRQQTFHLTSCKCWCLPWLNGNGANRFSLQVGTPAAGSKTSSTQSRASFINM